MPQTADRNLLFGILALQMDFITRDQLVAGMNAWVLDKAKSLGTVLVQQGALSQANHDLLAPLVDAHIRQHNNDPQQSLAAITPLSPLGPGAGGEGRSLYQKLEHLADPDVQASLGHLASRGAGGEGLSPAAADSQDSIATRYHAVGESSSTGLRFTILRPHAEGGLGKVSVARDEELHREVALKEIKEQHGHDENFRGRFLLEAEITGGLEHPGIVPVYGLGAYADGRPFYAMRFIRGDSLKEAIDRFHKKLTAEDAEERRESALHSSASSAVDFSSLDFRQLLRRFVDVCNAIAYAHSRGVLHRDLKPGNIMLGKYGETLVVDWGLAKCSPVAQSSPLAPREDSGSINQGNTAAARDPAAGLSRSERATFPEPALTPSSSNYDETIAGCAIGTPAFMSPEQAAGRLDLLGPASDVYSLGATLYQLLTGEPPLKNVPTGDILRRVQRGDIPTPRQICGAVVPAALDAICRKAMALQPADRYATPRALADDIEHWLADEPVSAYAEPLPVRAGRWARKHKTLVTGAAAALLVAVISLIVANRFLSEANETITLREKETREAGEMLAKSNEEIKLANLKLAKEQKETELARNAAQQSAKLASDRADKNEDDLATSTMQLARSRFEENNAGLANELLEQVPAKFRSSPWKLLKNYVAGSLATLRGHTAGVGCVTFSPDGQIVASGSHDQTVKLWDARTGQELRTLRGHTSVVTSVTFSPDGQVVATSSSDKTVTLWDARTGQERRAFRGHTAVVLEATFSPDGQVVASASLDQTVKLWDARTGREIRALNGHTDYVNSVAFSPDGQVVASGSGDETVKLWDARTGQELRALRGHTAEVIEVTFSPDGQVVASGSWDKTVKLWDARTGQEIRTLRGHLAAVNSVTFSPDGQVVASGSDDQTVKVWDARTGQEMRALRGHMSRVFSVAFSPDGQIVATGSNDQTVKLWNARTGQEMRALRGHPSTVTSVTFSPNGQIAATGSGDKTVKLWDARTGREIRALHGHTNEVSSVTISPDGQVVASGSLDNTVKLWDARSGQEIRTLTGRVVLSVAFSPDSQVVAAGSLNKTVTLWNARTGQEIRILRGHLADVASVAFSPDGLVVASASGDKTVKLWDAHTGEEIRTLQGHTREVTSVMFSPVGHVIASGSNDATVKLWDARTGAEIHTLRGHTAYVKSLAFSPDGLIVASGSWDFSVKLWDARTGQEIRTLRGHTAVVTSVTFTPDGQVVASGSHDNTMMFWDARSGEDLRMLLTAALPDPAEHRHHALQADQQKQPFAAACRLGHAIAARLRLRVSPWDPTASVHVVANGSAPALALAGWHGLDAGRQAQTAFVDGVTFAGILLKGSADSGPKSHSAHRLVLRARWAVDQWPQGWRNHEVLGGALYRAGDYQGAVKELAAAIQLRNGTRNVPATMWSCHFLALAHHKLGNQKDVAFWRIKAVLPKDANWEDAMIDRFLRREVETTIK